MIEKVKETIQKYDLLPIGSSVTVGVSGGADSVALLSVLLSLKEEFSLNISAVHVNHGIRGEEAQRDEDFVRDFCEKNNVELKVYKRDIPAEKLKTHESEEECARRIRYECFNDAAKGSLIATAHTLSDSIETMLFNMARGSSLSGLCSVPAKRGNIIRPLIDCTRTDVEDYCKTNALTFVTDSTNLSNDYTRNYIRHEILPKFSRINSNYISAFSRCLDFIREDNSFLEKLALDVLKEAKTEDGLLCDTLLKNERTIIKRAIHLFLKNEYNISAESRHIELIVNNLSNKFTLQLSDEFFICIDNRIIKVFQKAAKENNSKIYECLNIGLNETCAGKLEVSLINVEDLREKIKNASEVLAIYFDYDKINSSVVLRNRKSGDKITLLKRNVTKSLKKLLCEMKIPKNERDRLLIIADDNDVIWVEKVGINAKYAVDDTTENVMLIKRVIES